MELLKLLSNRPSRIVIDMAVQYVGNDPERFERIVNYVLSGNPPVPHMAAWVLTVCCEKNPQLLLPHIDKLIEALPSYYHSGITRMVLRSLMMVQIPDHVKGLLFEYCMKFYDDKVSPIAVKANAMEIMYNIASTEHELLQEFELMLEPKILSFDKGIKSKALKIQATIQENKKKRPKIKGLK